MKTVLLLLVVLLAAAAPAQADWRTDRAETIARAVWGGAPCNVTIRWVEFGRIAAPAQADINSCRIDLPSYMPMFWRELCRTVIHEYGHLAGFHDPLNTDDSMHSHDPRSVMAAEYSDDPRCRKRGRPYLARRIMKVRGLTLDRPGSSRSDLTSAPRF